MIYRLRSQKGTKGLVDFFLNFSPRGGQRQIGVENANRLNGRNILRGGLSHGMWEEEWEFRSSFEYAYYGRGEEQNGFTDRKYSLEDFDDFSFKFEAQYRLNPWLFLFASVEVEYTSSQRIVGKEEGEDREIQAGTGSIVHLGLKKPLSERHILGVGYILHRRDYFVRGESNLNGDLKDESFQLFLVSAF